MSDKRADRTALKGVYHKHYSVYRRGKEMKNQEKLPAVLDGVLSFSILLDDF